MTDTRGDARRREPGLGVSSRRRAALGLKQSEVAARVPINTYDYAGYERGSRLISLAMAEATTVALGLPRTASLPVSGVQAKRKGRPRRKPT